MVHWPAGIRARGEIRDQYAHFIDMVPTVLDVLGAGPPATVRGVTQAPIHGVSLARTFDDPAALTRRGRAGRPASSDLITDTEREMQLAMARQ